MNGRNAMLATLVAQSPWFRGWTPDAIRNLLPVCALRSFQRGQLVYRDDDEDGLALILSGTVWICLRNDREVVKFGVAYPSNLVGLSQLLTQRFHDEPMYELHAVDAVEILVIPKSAFLTQVNHKPELWRGAAEAAILYQRHCIKLSLVLCIGAVKDRVVSAIYQFGFAVSVHYASPRLREWAIPQDELARLIHSSRQHVNKALRELEAEGLIRVGYKRIEIVDEDELQKRAIARIRSGGTLQPPVAQPAS